MSNQLYRKCSRCDGTGWSQVGDLVNPSWCATCMRQGYVEVDPTGQVYFHEGRLKPMTFDEAEGYYDCYRRKEVGDG